MTTTIEQLELLDPAVRALVQKSLEYGPPSSTRAVQRPRAQAAPKPKPKTVPRPAVNPNVHTEEGRKVHNQIIDIALCLDGWEYDSTSTHCWEDRSNLIGAGGRGIHISADAYGHRGRWCISGNYPQAQDGYLFNPNGRYGWTVPGITCTRSKTAQQVARDIQRRLLPEYLPMWDKLAADRDQHDQVNQDAQDTMSALAEAGHGNIVPQHGQGCYPKVYNRTGKPRWDAEYMGYRGEIKITIDELTPAQAEQLVSLMLEWRTKK